MQFEDLKINVLVKYNSLQPYEIDLLAQGSIWQYEPMDCCMRVDGISDKKGETVVELECVHACDQHMFTAISRSLFNECSTALGRSLLIPTIFSSIVAPPHLPLNNNVNMEEEVAAMLAWIMREL